MAFLKRKIRVTFTLVGQATFDEGGNRVTISDKAVSAKISLAGAPYSSRAVLQIYGLTQSIMKQLATLGVKTQFVPKSEIFIEAGSDQPGDMAAIFQGNVVNCWGEFDASPDVPMSVESNATLAAQVISIKPSSFPGGTDVATVISGLATQMGMGFENNGVTAKVSAPYLSGSAWDQAEKIAKDANVRIIPELGRVIIWPKGGSRGGLIPTISPGTGMIGYPTFTDAGLMVRTEYRRGLACGGRIKIEGSILEPANKTWQIYGLDHQLDAEIPGGRWESLVQAQRLVDDGSDPPPVQPK